MRLSTSPTGGHRGMCVGTLLLLTLFFCYTPFLAADTLRVATYNVFVGNQDLERSIEILQAADLDLVALQEVTQEHANTLIARLSERFPYRFFPRSTHSSGLAILSRFPLSNERYQPSKQGLNGFAFAEFEFAGRRVQVANLHLDPIRTWTLWYKFTVPWQLLRQGTRHRGELEQVSAELKPMVATIVLGDFNTFASSAAPDELVNRGFVDSYAAVNPNVDGVATHHAKFFGISINRRIDFLFHSRDLQTVGSEILRGEPSDHDMVRSALRWAE